MNVDRNRFRAGFVLFVTGFIWNVYFSVAPLAPSGPSTAKTGLVERRR